MFNQIMELKMLDQEKSDKNLQLETQVAKLEATVDKIRYQLRQKNMHEADLRKSYSAQKREQKLYLRIRFSSLNKSWLK